MAKMGNIQLKVDPFFTDTRVRICGNPNCKYQAKDGVYCILKIIDIDKQGKCKQFEKKEEDNAV